MARTKKTSKSTARKAGTSKPTKAKAGSRKKQPQRSNLPPVDDSSLLKDDNASKESSLECDLPESKEPEIPWAESKTRELLLQDIIDEVVPREPCSSMPSQTIFTSRPEYAEYGYEKFCSRLSRLRVQVKREVKRSDDDLAAFNNFKANNIAHAVTAHGYPEWEGSDAQKQLKKDIDDGYHDLLEPKELWLFREVYDDFPLVVFKDHIYQEVKTRKYLHTLEVKGKKNMKPGSK